MLFPGYIFVSLSTNVEDWHKVRNTVGVASLISFSEGKPAIVPISFIHSLMDKCDESDFFLGFSDFKEGEMAKFMAGPFTDKIALIEKISSSERVWVLLDIMGSKKKINTHKDTLTKI